MVSAACEAHAAGQALVVITAREWRHLPITASWLNANLPVPVASIFMRRDGDRRPDDVVKRDLLREVREAHYRPVHAYDDNPNVALLYKSEGIPTTFIRRG